MNAIRGQGEFIRGRGLIEDSSDGVAVIDDQGTILYCNPALEMILGLRREEAVGRTIDEFVHSGDRRIIARALAECIANNGKAVTTQVRVAHGNGSFRFLQVVLRSRLDDAEIRGIVCNCRDVSRIMVAEEGWRESEERFAKAVRSSPVAKSIATLAARYVEVNDAYLQMLDYESEDIIGHNALDLNIWVDPEDRTRMLQNLRESKVVKGCQTKLRAAQGEIREVTVYAELIELEGEPCVLAIIQDLTEAMRLEDQFRQSQKMEAVGRLAGGIAHDFNNLLGVMMGYRELSVQQVSPDTQVAKNLIQIKEAAERAVRLTKQLLAFSRKQVLYPRILDLNSLVTNLSEMLLRMIGEDVAISFQPAAAAPRIKADPGQIEQILMNLVVNARDAMPKGGNIMIGTSNVELDENYAAAHRSVPSGHYVVLSVTYTGCGMDQETLGHIFEPFYTMLRAANAAQAICVLKDFNGPVHLLLTDVLMPEMSGDELSTHLKTLRPELNILLMSGYAGDLPRRCSGERAELPLLEKPFTRRHLLATVDAIIHLSAGASLDPNPPGVD